MPRVPRYEPQVAPQGAPNTQLQARATPEQYGAGLGRAISGASVEFARIAAAERDKAHGDALQGFSLDLDSLANNLLNDPQGGFKARVNDENKFDGNAYAELGQKFDDFVESRLDSFPTEIRDRAINIAKGRRNALDIKRDAIMEARITDLRTRQALKSEENAVAEAASFYAEPGSIAGAMFHGEEGIRRALGDLGFSEEDINDRVQKFSGTAWYGVISSAIADDSYDLAREYLNGPAHSSLRPKEIEVLGAAIDRGIMGRDATDAAREVFNSVIDPKLPFGDAERFEAEEKLWEKYGKKDTAFYDESIQRFRALYSSAASARKQVVATDAADRLDAIESSASRVEALDVANSAPEETRRDLLKYVDKTMPDPAAELAKKRQKRFEAAEDAANEFEVMQIVESYGGKIGRDDLLRLTSELDPDATARITKVASGLSADTTSATELANAVDTVCGIGSSRGSFGTQAFRVFNRLGFPKMSEAQLLDFVRTIQLNFAVSIPGQSQTTVRGEEVLVSGLEKFALPVLDKQTEAATFTRMRDAGISIPTDPDEAKKAAAAYVAEDLFGPNGLRPDARAVDEDRRIAIEQTAKYMRDNARTAQESIDGHWETGATALQWQLQRGAKTLTPPTWMIASLKRLGPASEVSVNDFLDGLRSPSVPDEIKQRAILGVGRTLFGMIGINE